MHSRRSAVMLFAAFLLVAGVVTSSPEARAENAAVTCRVESPADGSFWIGTAGDGLFRLGRNGRTVRYTVEGGQLGSNHIKALIFDNQKRLWILGGDGCFSTYSSVKGFLADTDLPSGILAAVAGPDPGRMYFATSDKIYLLKTDVGEISELAALSVVAQSLQLSDDGKEIWVFAKDCVQKVSSGGGVIEWPEIPGVSNLLPFEFETKRQTTHVGEGSRISIFSAIPLLIIAFLLGFILRYVPVRRSGIKDAKTTSVAAEATNESADNFNVPEAETSDKDSVSPSRSDDTAISSITLDSPNTPSGEFTSVVLKLVQENLSDPSFGVDAIATLTGLSRIHVNRKLKAEGSPSPSVLIRDARMSLASELLKHGTLNITQISSRCGYRTPSYFATAFRDYYGVSPSEYL